MSGFLSVLVPLETGGFEAPGVQSFDVPPLFEGVPWFDKYMLQALVSVILILGLSAMNSATIFFMNGPSPPVNPFQ